MKRNKKLLMLTERDIKLFDYLFMNKVALPTQVNRDVFGNISLTDVYRRLRMLCNANLLENRGVIISKRPCQVFSLTKLGFCKLKGDDDFGKIRKQLNSDSIIHDIRLIDIQYRFKQLKMTLEYFSENLIRSNCEYAKVSLNGMLGNINCDSVVKMKFPKNEYFLPIEYELNQKGGKRYDNLFLNYYLNSKIEALLYIVHDEQILKCVVNRARSIGEGFPAKIFFITYDKFMQNTEQVIFTNHLGQKMLLN
ncbi:MAG: hypothetical protein HQK49_21800 [Oligoflexia bacterium]|nr:hypothetical protein [Oligoflexia bacterium]